MAAKHPDFVSTSCKICFKTQRIGSKGTKIKVIFEIMLFVIGLYCDIETGYLILAQCINSVSLLHDEYHIYLDPGFLQTVVALLQESYTFS